MKNVIKSLVVASAMVAAGSASADLLGDFNPVVGVDYLQTWMKPKSGFQNTYAKSFPGATIYVGSKFNENFGLELGFDWTATKKKTVTVKDQKFAGNVTETTTSEYKARKSGGHLDLVGFLPVNECFDVFASVGLGLTRINLKDSYVFTRNVAKAISDEAEGLRVRKSKTRAIARVGLGANYMVTDVIGLRAKLGWENTSKVDFTRNNGTKLKPFKDAVTGAVGVFAKF